MRRRWGLLAAGIALGLAAAGCADALLTPNPGDSPPEVAEAMWTAVDRYYSFFEVKGINWDSIGAEYLPRITNDTPPIQLFDVMAVMLSKLQDGHATLDSPDRHYEYDGWFQDYPPNYSPGFVDPYLGTTKRMTAGAAVVWGRVGGGVGYLRISTFESQEIGTGVDEALASLGDSLSGLIIDVRSNGGGSDAQAEAAAGHFTRERVQYAYHRYKNGPGHDDFGPRIPDWLEPTGPHGYYGPVAILTNRGVYSAAEDFILAMRALPRVVTVGDTTGGGSGNPVARELPNGWVVHIPRWQLWGVDGTFFEGIGLAPDVPQQITEDDRLRARDSILERAREVLFQMAG